MNEQDFYPESSRSLDSLRHMRLMALLRDMIDDGGKVRAAKALGVNYRTVSKAVGSGTLTDRMSDALERHLLLGGGSAAAQQRDRVDALVERVSALERELRGGLEAVVGWWGSRSGRGRSAYGDDGDDLMMALARKIVSGDEEEDETVEDVLAQARDAEAASEEFLVDDGWKVVESLPRAGHGVEPEAAPVNGDGHHADGIGPTVELVLDTGHHANGNGHAAVEVNGNGHSDEVPEPQQSLFSWVELMAEEPVKPKGRGGKPQPAMASLFDWALSLEQEREKKLVGGGR